MYDMHPFNRPFSGEAWQAPHIIKSYQDVLPDLHWRIQDILNSQIRAGLTLCEMAELPATDAFFWFTFAELQQKRAGGDQRLEEKPHGRVARMAGVGFEESGVKNAGLRLVQSVGTGQTVSAL